MERGAQPGNQNAAKGRAWRDAINRALEKRSGVDRVKALDDLAEKFLSEVEKAGIAGFKELGDRIDGKPDQAITGADGGDLIVRLMPADEAL